CASVLWRCHSLYLCSPSALSLFLLFSFSPTSTPDIYTLSLHDALPISSSGSASARRTSSVRFMRNGLSRIMTAPFMESAISLARSEEHTSELQSRFDLVCRLLLEKKKRVTTK